MKAAIIYSRVSTTDQVRGTSLDTQVDECRAFASQHGYTVIKEIREDFTGTVLARKGLDEVRDLAANHTVQAVIVAEQDRLSRSLAHTLLLVEEFERLGVALLFVREPQEATPEGKMLFQMKGMFKEYERAKFLERARRGKERRLHEGTALPTWMTPFGYRYRPDKKGLELVEEEAHWVASIFNWVTQERCTLGEVVRRLNQFCVPTKRGGPNWYPSAIRSILTNQVYTGTWYWNKQQCILPTKTRNPDRKRLKTARADRPTEDWIGLQVPAIITPDTFDRAQQQLQRNKEMSARNCKHNYLLRGLLFCKHCGQRLRGRPYHGGKYYYYECPRGQYKPGVPKCNRSHLAAGKVEEGVWNEVLRQLSDPELLSQALRQRADQAEAKRCKDDAELDAIHNLEQAIKRERDKMIDLHVSDLIDRGTLTERMEMLKKRSEALDVARNEVMGRIAQREGTEVNIEVLQEVANAVRGLPFLGWEDRRQLLDVLQIKCTVDGKRIHVAGLITEALLDLPGTRKGYALHTHDVMRVPGIKEGLFAKVRDYITMGP